ncbi:hypothetical protein SNE40_006529 [Patella caerulea]|uniref:Uncharacterized protein n=1 Tax=Patella caerulea TaxID=87958 RepID=A0AAN8PTQ4_PATCE
MADELNLCCSICLNAFNNPKIIDCHHTFCESCLTDYVANAVTNNQFLCPLCRREITVPDGGVKDFSANFYITDTPQVPPQQPEEIQQASRCMCTQHLREKELFCCNCCEAVCLKCFISRHPGHTLETVHGVENKLIEKLTQFREDVCAYILKYQEMMAPPIATVQIKSNLEWRTLNKEESKTWLCEVIRESEALERKLSTILTNCNLSDMLNEIREFGLIMDSAKNELSIELDRRDKLNSPISLRGERSYNVLPPVEGGVHSSGLDINLLPQSLRREIAHSREPGQPYNRHGNTMVYWFNVNAIGRTKKLLSSPTYLIGGELWSLGCICDNQHRKASQLSISLKRICVRSSSSSLFAKFTMILSGETKSRINENEFYFTPRSNYYKWSDSRMKYSYISNPTNGYVNHDNKITITVLFHQFMVNRTPTSGITSSRAPMRYTQYTESQRNRSFDRHVFERDIPILWIGKNLRVVCLLFIIVAPIIYGNITCTVLFLVTYVAILCILFLSCVSHRSFLLALDRMIYIFSN